MSKNIKTKQPLSFCTANLATARAIKRNNIKASITEFRKIAGHSNKKFVTALLNFSGKKSIGGINERLTLMLDMIEDYQDKMKKIRANKEAEAKRKEALNKAKDIIEDLNTVSDAEIVSEVN